MLKLFTTFDVNAGHAIAVNAKALDADVIVVGSRGRGPLASVVLGSTTQHLLHEAECPVFAVTPNVHAPEPELV